MTLVLELPAEIEAQLRRAAASAGQDISAFVIEAAQEKAREEEFDEELFHSLAEKEPMDAFYYLLAHTPDHRGDAGLGPLPDDAIAESYIDAVLGEED